MSHSEKDRLLETRRDRRLLPDVPDPSHQRSNIDRRGGADHSNLTNKNIDDFIKVKEKGIRYKVLYQVQIICRNKKTNKKEKITVEGADVSMTGILLKIENKKDLHTLKEARTIQLKFKITPGTLPEGLEMKVKTYADLKRVHIISDTEIYCGFQFEEDLSVYRLKRKDRYMLGLSSLFLFLISAFIILMRAESFIYFRFNRTLYLYSMMAAFFLLSRYLFAVFYKEKPIDVNFTPGVTIVIPCFNEEEWIRRTIVSCVNQNYPIEKLEVIVVDDASTDQSPKVIRETVQELSQEENFQVDKRLSHILMKENGGKRQALAHGIEKAKHDLIVFVDSDSFLDPFAIRHLVQPFKDPKMGGVSGRTEVANTYTNALTKMQSVRYHIAFRVMKAAESIFDTVSCLSGPLSAYRKDIVMDNMDDWLDQTFLGHEATFGDDRSMTNFVLKKHRTSYQDSAVCYTIVPNTYDVFLKQQMRWKRSWLRESLIAGRFMWKKEGFAALTFYIGILVPILAPVVVIYNLLYIPLVYRVFPTTFLVGILLMALLLSVAQLFLRKSTTWVFGLLFVLYYEAVLLWQMPIAWVTFWKSTWGTRMTPSDVEAQNKKESFRKNGLWGEESEKS